MENVWSMPDGITNTSAWLREYAISRYPSPVLEHAHAAWKQLHQSVYSCDTDHRLGGCRNWNCDAGACHPCNKTAAEGCSGAETCEFPHDYTFGFSAPGMTICQMPAKHLHITPNINEPPWVCTGDPDDTSLGLAWANFLAAARQSSAYRSSDTFAFDLVVTTAQALNMVAWDAHNRTSEALANKDLAGVRTQRTIFMGLIDDLDELLATRPLFLLGKWLAGARMWGNSSAPYHASCDAPAEGRSPCTTGTLVRAGRMCATSSTNCSASAHCVTCASSAPDSCLTCEAGHAFFDFGKLDCTGSCGSASRTAIDVDDCEYQNCCYDDSVPEAAACYVRPLSPEALFTIDAKNVVTALGTQDDGLQDYAARLWSGLVGDYYHGRWQRWFDYVEHVVQANATYDDSLFETQVRQYQEEWLLDDTRYSTEASGNAVALSSSMFTKYSHLLRGGSPSV
jgi:hypothetical protein